MEKSHESKPASAIYLIAFASPTRREEEAISVEQYGIGFKKGNEELKGEVRFYDVDFGYTKEKMVLHDITLYAEPGQKVAFVGATGAGKTTIVNLLMRFYELKQPRLIINGEITKHKVFDNGKSVSILIDENNNLYINGKTSHYLYNHGNSDAVVLWITTPPMF